MSESNVFNFSSSNNFEVNKGLFYTKQIGWTDSADTAINITAFDFNMVIRNRATKVAVLTLAVQVSAAVTGIYIVDAANGLFSINITGTDSDITAESYIYELVYTNTSLQEFLFLSGQLQVVDRNQ